jgi:tRNA threonylcarbamoyladenosine biosynthesis protein TsaE
MAQSSVEAYTTGLRALVTPMSKANLHLPDASATEGAGARLATRLRGGMVITLSGDLGAGKTTLVRGCLHALGWAGPVKSPSYTVVEHYELSSLYFYHFDFYRFADPSEWETAGLADCFRDDAICVVEWPERVDGLLPQPDLALTLAHPADPAAPGRQLALVAHTEEGERCLTAMTSDGGAAPA